MRFILFLLSTGLFFSTAQASNWHCWEEVETTICRDSQTGQIIRKTISPDGIATYRDNYGNIIQSYKDQYGATRYLDEHRQEIDPFAPKEEPKKTYKSTNKEIYYDNLGNQVTVQRKNNQIIYEDQHFNKLIISKDVFGDTVYKYPDGTEVTVKKDVLGDTVYEYSDGYKITKKQNIGGGYQYSDNQNNQINVQKNMFRGISYTNQDGYTITQRKTLDDMIIFEDEKGNEIKKRINSDGSVLYYLPNGDIKRCEVDFLGKETCQNF